MENLIVIKIKINDPKEVNVKEFAEDLKDTILDADAFNDIIKIDVEIKEE